LGLLKRTPEQRTDSCVYADARTITGTVETDDASGFRHGILEGGLVLDDFMDREGNVDYVAAAGFEARCTVTLIRCIAARKARSPV